jgi:hypothetical protein
MPHCPHFSTFNRKIPHCPHISTFNKKIPHCPHISTFNRKIVERNKIDNSNTQIYDRSLGTGTSIKKNGRVKLDLWAQTFVNWCSHVSAFHMRVKCQPSDSTAGRTALCQWRSACWYMFYFLKIMTSVLISYINKLEKSQ